MKEREEMGEAKDETHRDRIESEKERRSRIKKWLAAAGKGTLVVGAVICSYLFGKKKSAQSQDEKV